MIIIIASEEIFEEKRIKKKSEKVNCDIQWSKIMTKIEPRRRSCQRNIPWSKKILKKLKEEGERKKLLFFFFFFFFLFFFLFFSFLFSSFLQSLTSISTLPSQLNPVWILSSVSPLLQMSGKNDIESDFRQSLRDFKEPSGPSSSFSLSNIWSTVDQARKDVFFNPLFQTCPSKSGLAFLSILWRFSSFLIRSLCKRSLAQPAICTLQFKMRPKPWLPLQTQCRQRPVGCHSFRYEKEENSCSSCFATSTEFNIHPCLQRYVMFAVFIMSGLMSFFVVWICLGLLQSLSSFLLENWNRFASHLQAMMTLPMILLFPGKFALSYSFGSVLILSRWALFFWSGWSWSEANGLLSTHFFYQLCISAWADDTH